MTDPADALRDLANAHDQGAPPKRPASPSSSRPESPVSPRPESPVSPATPDPSAESSTALDELSLASASALAELSGTDSAPYDPAMSSQARRRRLQKPDVGMMHFRLAAVPVLITVGLLMLALGLWGILVKAGNTTLPKADLPDAGTYATLALVCLPIGLLLIAGAWFFFYQVRIDQRKLKAYEDAMKKGHGW